MSHRMRAMCNNCDTKSDLFHSESVQDTKAALTAMGWDIVEVSPGVSAYWCDVCSDDPDDEQETEQENLTHILRAALGYAVINGVMTDSEADVIEQRFEMGWS